MVKYFKIITSGARLPNIVIKLVCEVPKLDLKITGKNLNMNVEFQKRKANERFQNNYNLLEITLQIGSNHIRNKDTSVATCINQNPSPSDKPNDYLFVNEKL